MLLNKDLQHERLAQNCEVDQKLIRLHQGARAFYMTKYSKDEQATIEAPN